MLPLNTLRLTVAVLPRYDPTMNLRNPVVALWTFVIFTAIGVFFAFHQHLDDVLFNPNFPLKERFLYELSGAWGAMLMLPLLNWVSLRFPIRWTTWLRVIAVNILVFPVYTLGHDAFNDLIRFLLAPLLGVTGVTPFGFFREAASEAANDIVYFAMLMATLYLINHFIKAQELEAKLVAARLENLRLQLQPHFLFNTLNAISSVMYEDVRKADRMLAQLSDFLRAVLDSSGVNQVHLDEELAIERMYVDIMKTRLERSLSLEVRVADDARGAIVPFMILQPLLENSIQHGMSSERQAIDLAINVRRVNGSTEIQLTDDGVGYAPSSSPGIGLANVRSRLEHMYGANASFDIAARKEGGTLAIIRLPYAAEGR